MMFFYTILVLISYFSCTFSQRKPVFIIHGIGGVQMEAKLNRKFSPHIYCKKSRDWYQTWLTVFDNILEVECFIDNFKLTYDAETNSMINQEGVQIRTLQPWGNVEGVAYLDTALKHLTAYLNKIIDVLTYKFQYVNLKDMFAVTYDFRALGDYRKMVEYFDRVSHLIEIVSESTNKNVILVSHSMGSPVVAKFLEYKSEEWKDKYIDSWYSINGAIGGSVKSAVTVLKGDTFGIPPFIASATKFRSVIVTHPSTYYLLPSTEIFYKDRIVISYNNTDYSINQMRDILPTFMFPDMSKVMKNIPDPFVKSPPNVHMECVFGNGVPTAVKFTFKTLSFDDDVITEYGDGDGTVNIESLRACEKWKKDNKKDIRVTIFPNSSHNGLLSDKSLLKHFQDFISRRIFGVEKHVFLNNNI